MHRRRPHGCGRRCRSRDPSGGGNMTRGKLPIPRSLVLAVFLACGTMTAIAVDAVVPATANAQVDVGFFYSGLAPHGSWAFQANFGWVWRPHHLGAGWRPYTLGHWAWTDDY